MVPVLPGWVEHMQSLGGMEDVCRVVIDVHDLMGWEFSLMTQWMCEVGLLDGVILSH